MRALRPILAAFAVWTILHGTGSRLPARNAEPLLYLVLFRPTVGEDGKLQSLEAARIVDLLSGSDEAVTVELPQAFLDHTRKKVEAENLRPSSENGVLGSPLVSFLYVPGDEEHGPADISFGIFNEVMSSNFSLRFLRESVAVSAYAASLKHSAFFVSFYALASVPKGTTEQRAAIIEAEIQRNVANLENATLLSRKDLSTDSQNIVEVTCQSSKNKALTLRSRYVCSRRQMLTLTAVTPDRFPAVDAQAVDGLFDAFRFR